MRVVHRDHQRATRGQVSGQPVQAVHRRVRDIVLDRPRLGPVEHPRGQPGSAVQQPVPLPGPGGGADRLDELADDAVGEAALQREPARGEDLAARRGGRADGPQQGRLPDPGGAFHQHQAAPPSRGAGNSGRQHGKLLVAPDDSAVAAHDSSFTGPALWAASVRPGQTPRQYSRSRAEARHGADDLHLGESSGWPGQKLMAAAWMRPRAAAGTVEPAEAGPSGAAAAIKSVFSPS